MNIKHYCRQAVYAAHFGLTKLFCLLFLISLLGFHDLSAQCTATSQTTAVGASLGSSGTNGICLFCSVTGENNLVDANTSNFASINIPVGVFGSGFVDVNLGQTYPAGTRAGFMADVNGGIAGLLNGVTLTTFLGGSQQQSISGGSLVNILGFGGGQNVAATFCQPFDRIRITAGSLAGVLASYRIFNAFVVADCQYPVACGASPSTEICDDGIDNDGNFLVDCEDGDCANSSFCNPSGPVCSRTYFRTGSLGNGTKSVTQYPTFSDFINNTNGVFVSGSAVWNFDDSFFSDGEFFYRTTSPVQLIVRYPTVQDMMNGTNGTSFSFTSGGSPKTWNNDDDFFASENEYFRTSSSGGTNGVTAYPSFNDLVNDTNGSFTSFNTSYNFFDQFFHDGQFFYRTAVNGSDHIAVVRYASLTDLANSNSTSSFSFGPWNDEDDIFAFSCPIAEICNNGIDDDGDGQVDCADGDCATVSVCTDWDSDGIPDITDLDDDNDGIFDTVEDPVINTGLTGATVSSSTASVSGFTFTNTGGIAFVPSSSGIQLGPNGSALTTIVTVNFAEPVNAFTLGVADYDKEGGHVREELSNFSVAPTSLAGQLEFNGSKVVPTANNSSGQITWDNLGGATSLSFTHQRDFSNLGVTFTSIEAAVLADNDGDGIPNSCDLDSDNDGCSDANEYYDNAIADGGDGGEFGTGTPIINAQGQVVGASYIGSYPNVINAGISNSCTDTDGDGIIDAVDLDDDNDGIADVVENSVGGGDTDGDGIPNRLDLDSDNDGINDVTEAGGTDANGDGQADGAVGTAASTNGIPSSANTGLTPPDTDGDGIVDHSDLDSDNDTVSDLVEGGSGAPDADDNGVADGPDADSDGIVDAADGSPADFGDSGNPAPTDTDGEGTPDYLDPDSDDPTDNVVDATDGTGDDIDDNGNAPLDADQDGLVDNPTDTDEDGIADVVDEDIPDFGGLGAPDTDGDGIPDAEDLDDDNDGITDVVEDSVGGGDTDGDGVPNRLDLDSDNDGINDVIEADGTDNNGDGIADGAVGTGGTTNGIPASAGTGLIPPDTDGDGIVDHSDLDSDNDTVSDLVESGSGAPDADDNGVVDGPDADGDGILDPVDGAPATFADAGDQAPADTDGEGTPDYQDPDSDDPTDNVVDATDGIGDDIDNAGNSPLDADQDGLVDNPTDTDEDGIADVVDDEIPVFGGLAAPSGIDTDGDGIPDSEDLDDDNDGITDVVENLTATNGGDTDGDGIPDALDLDSDNDGINDVEEAGGTDANNDGIADGAVGTVPTTNGIPASAGTGLTPPNTDNDGQPDFQDLDSDNDTVSDLVEGGSGAPDADDNGVADGPDADGDGIVDAADGSLAFGDANDPVAPDTDGEGTPDYLDPDSDDPTENTVGGTDGLGDDIDNAGNGPLDGNGDGLVDNPTDTDLDGIADVADEDVPEFGGLGAPDTDGDGIPDTEDLDDDNDGITDAVENLTASNGGDTDGDGAPDQVDLDSDNDGINDVDEAGGIDANDDGIADGAVGTNPLTNGIPSSAGTGLTPPNTDNDGQPDFQDLDSDNDTVSDLIEGGSGAPDTDDNGVADGPDTDGDGILDPVDGNNGTFGDLNNPVTPDTDGEGTPDYLDPDSDDPTDNTVDNTDGANDDIDDAGNSPLDGNNDGLIDSPVDTDGDGIADVADEDVPEFGGLGAPDGTDTDGDGIPDAEDLDDDNDGITDAVENLTASNGGDTDGDGAPDQVDLDSDNDGINDVDEAGGIDANDDGIADGAVGTNPLTNGIPSSAGTGLTPPNTDNDGQPDFQDLDSDNDGISDLVESGDPSATDADDDGVVDGPDTDGDGIQDPTDGTPTFGDAGQPTPADDDGDGLPNYTDPDSDDPTNTLGNGNDDVDDSGNGPLDGNNDGQLDNPTDTDDDGIADVVDEDIPDFGGLGSPAGPDTDGDSVPDAQDLDDDNDGITDVVENLTAGNNGDTDGDGIPDQLDLDSDDDGINDVDEAGGIDNNNDGLADGPAGTIPGSTLGVPATAGTGINPANTDNDPQPDFQDLDSDNDTVSDLIEGGSGAPDADDNGVIDAPDQDGDGIKDPVDGAPAVFGDANDPAAPDSDGEGTPDYQDPDSDDPADNTVDATDGANDDIDDAGNSPLDGNNDGLVDNPTDTDQDGIADVVDADIPDFGGLGAPVVAAPDLFPNFTFSNTTYNDGDSRFVILNINEIAGNATSGQIQFFVPNSAGFTYTFNPGQTDATVFVSESVNNTDWTVSNTGTGLLFTSNAVVAGGSRSRVALEVTANVPGTKANLTVNIVPNSGGESNVNNNIAVLAQSIQN